MVAERIAAIEWADLRCVPGEEAAGSFAALSAGNTSDAKRKRPRLRRQRRMAVRTLISRADRPFFRGLPRSGTGFPPPIDRAMTGKRS